MVEYLPDHLGIFDAGDDLHGSAAGLASLDIDVEHALETLRPGHDDMAFDGCPFCKSIGSIGIASLAPAGRRDQCPVIAVGGEYAMEAGKIDARLRDKQALLGPLQIPYSRLFTCPSLNIDIWFTLY